MYSYTNFKDQVFDPLVYPNIDTTMTTRNILNRAVRNVVRAADLRSCRRKAATSPVVFDGIYDYAWPTDGKGNSIIDLAPQVNRSRWSELFLTTPEEFDRKKTDEDNLLAINDAELLKKLRASIPVDGKMLTVSTLDDLTAGGGTWSAVGDAENLTADADSFVKGSGSIRYDIGSGGGTTAGIQNTGLDEFDYSDYVDLNRSVFHWVYITSITNLTNFILRVGSSSSAYHQITVTTTNEGTAFRVGWNLLRFDFVNKTTTGSPDSESGVYAAIYMTKAAGKINETGYRADQIIMESGAIYDLFYYTKYGWQTSAGVYLENSTADTDNCLADTDEFELFVLSGKVETAVERKDFDVLPYWKQELENEISKYRQRYPSEAKVLTNVLYDT